MEKSIKSKWWFLSNINFVTVGISYFLYLIILLIGNFINVEVQPIVAAVIISLIFIVSNFIAVKLAFREAKIDKSELIKYFILNFILFFVISFKFIPFIAEYIGFILTKELVVSIVVSIVTFAINALFVFNLKD